MTKNELRDLIVKEIDLTREKTGEINLMASGGVDSGVLMALSNPDRIFTVRLPYGDRHDEFKDFMKSVRHLGYEDRVTVVDLDERDFDEYVGKAVKAIGRPIPHFNIFPLYALFKKMNEMGLTTAVCGDGPDETMGGYTRHIIMLYMFSMYEIEAFNAYHPMIDKVLGSPSHLYSQIIGKSATDVSMLMANKKNGIDAMCAVDMAMMRPDMDDMSNGIAKNFGIEIHRPYQDGTLDEVMFDLPPENKIQGEYGKYLLREVAGDLLPEEIAWRKQKIGGPLVPVNQIKGWDLPPFDKSMWMKYQADILEN